MPFGETSWASSWAFIPVISDTKKLIQCVQDEESCFESLPGHGLPRSNSRSKCFQNTVPTGNFQGSSSRNWILESALGKLTHLDLVAWSDQKRHVELVGDKAWVNRKGWGVEEGTGFR